MDVRLIDVGRFVPATRGVCSFLSLLSGTVILAILMLSAPASSATIQDNAVCDVPGIIDDVLYDQRTIWSSSVTIAVDQLATSDLDGDGCEDVVICTEDGSLSVYSPALDNELWSISLSGVSFYSFAVGDVDGDGMTEVLVSSSNGLYCFEYGKQSVQWVRHWLNGVHSLTLSDFNSNGTEAIFFLNYTTLYRLDGQGREVFNETIDPIDNELGRLSMMVVDADMDEWPEVIVTDSGWDWLGGSPRTNGHHIWVFDCGSGRTELIKTIMSGLFCSKPTLIDIDDDRYLAIGLHHGAFDFVLYSIDTDTELAYDVFDIVGDAITWRYVATIPGNDSTNDRLLLCGQTEVLVWSNGSTRPDWSWDGGMFPMPRPVIRDQPLVCDINSDGCYEVLVPTWNITIFDAGTGKVEGTFGIDNRSTKLDVLMSLFDADGDGLSEICYGYYEKRQPLYIVFLIDSPGVTVSLDLDVLVPPAMLYPTHIQHFGFLIDNITVNRLHYSLRLASSNDDRGTFHTVDISLDDGTILFENGSLLTASEPVCEPNGNRMYIQVGLRASWGFSYEGPNNVRAQVRSSVDNLTSESFEDVFRVERGTGRRGSRCDCHG